MREYEDDEYYEDNGSSGRDYRRDDGYGRRYSDNPEFDDEEFGGAYRARGQRRSDRTDDFDDRDGGRTRRPPQRPRSAEPRREYRGRADYAADDSYEAPRRRRSLPDPDDDHMDSRNVNTAAGFRKRHPVLMQLIYICVAAIVACWLLMLFLDYWTFHGQERTVPDVKGQVYTAAAGNVSLAGLRPVLTDSVFDTYSRPGTVVEQIPIPGARVKKGGTVYLTIVAFSPKLVTVPDFMNVSARQARSMFEGLGIREVREVPVVSEYNGLVLGAKFNGAALRPGDRIPVSATVTIEVGTGYSYDNADDDDDDDDVAVADDVTEISAADDAEGGEFFD